MKRIRETCHFSKDKFVADYIAVAYESVDLEAVVTQKQLSLKVLKDN